MSDTFYPASPEVDRSQITKMTGKYRTQIIVNLLAIILFFLLYLCMIVVAGFLIYHAWSYPLSYDFSKWEVLAKVGAVAMSVMFFLFLLKFLFKRTSSDDPSNIEIFEKDHPELFSFIRKLSAEVGAPFPKKIFVNHEINASVFYNSTVLSLFIPVKKNLLIGLGLVNSVNLSEFKAIMAHEFGHFAQSSMKLGSYVYMANHIIYDMVYERDQWDIMLERWKGLDFRIAVFGWILSPVIWIVRQFMSLLYRVLNMLHSALSRQMEYNADLVAVSVTGSNQIINGLYKMGLTSQSYQLTLSKLSDARDQQIHSEDLFYNHTECHKYLLATNKEFAAEEITRKVTDLTSTYELFAVDEDETTLAMYASHPSNYKRERNAKRLFIEGVQDERSPWMLFGDAQNLAHEVTKNLYSLSLDQEKINFKPKEEVQKFIIAELSEAEFGERYMQYFDSHVISLPKEDRTEPEIVLTAEKLRLAIADLWGDDFKSRMTTINTKREKLIEVVNFVQNPPKGGSIEVNGKQFKAKDSVQAYHAINKIMEEDSSWFIEYDEKIYSLYTQMNALLRPADRELTKRYKFLKQTNDMSRELGVFSQDLDTYAQEVSELTQPEEEDISGYAIKFNTLRSKFEKLLREANGVDVPALNNIGNIDKLGQFLLPIPPGFISSTDIDFNHVQQLAYQISDASSRLDRLANKNLGALLKLQESLEEELKLMK
ncbi:MAG: hypothetical protein Roseis2KO_12770 [Roseivirga sp.]